MKKILLVSVLVLLVGVVTLAGTVTVVDQTGRTVLVTQPVTRIASVYGISTYYVYALGAQGRLVMAGYVGVKDAANAPAALKTIDPDLKEKITFGVPNVEEIASLSPDLVLSNPLKDKGMAPLLAELGIPTIEYAPEGLERVKEGMLLTGKVLGKDAYSRAQAFARDYDRIIAAVSTAVAGRTPVSVYFCGTNKLRVISGDMYQTEMIALAGGESVSEKLKGYWNNVNLEQVLAWNPEVIIIAPYGKVTPSDILDDPDWGSIAAVRSGRVYKMPRVIAPWDTPVPDSLVGILWLAAVLHPGAVPLDLAAELERFYSTYYGYELAEEEVGRLLPQ
ncbi:MAG TPA: hypothetical protein ENF29_02905 [Candidatus Acetothermia bacterium]|nr:hypothetical protein [Candidatus Acetothermia bacterium]